jgi:hypothetical protein
MSRFTECDYEASDEELQEFDRQLAREYAASKDDLRTFLAFLDGMPTKEIIADRFFMPASKRMCGVAAFCAAKGVSEADLRETETQSRLERLVDRWDGGEGAESSYGWDGATVDAGVRAGLSLYVAHDLGFQTDQIWRRVKTGIEHVPGQGYVTQYRDMTPAERWLRLRNYIAVKVGNPPIELHHA